MKEARVKIAGASVAYSVLCSAITPSENSIPMIACRETLSLNAPKHCVAKNGRKRRWRSSWNWLWPDMRGSPWRPREPSRAPRNHRASHTPGAPDLRRYGFGLAPEFVDHHARQHCRRAAIRFSTLALEIGRAHV